RFQPWKRGEPFDPAALEADMLRLRKFYFDRGFLSATASVESVTQDPESQAYTIVIKIDQGPVTQVRSVEIAGEFPPELPSEKKLLGLLELQPGDRLTLEAFDSSVARLSLRMQNAGYARARIVPETTVNPDTHEADVIFSLDPGDPTPFGEITITGEKQVPEPVIRRQLKIKERELYSARDLIESQGRIYDLGMFRAVTPRQLNMDETGTPLNVDFEVTERKPRTVRVGIGASSVESMRYEIEWVQRNFRQQAQRLSFLGRVTGISQTVEAKLFDPYVFGPDTTMSWKLFALNYKQLQTDPFGLLNSIFDIVDPFPAYNLLTAGGEWQIEHEFTHRVAGAAGLELTSNTFYDVDLAASQEALEGVEDNKLFIEYASGRWDNRDNRINTRRGWFLGGQIDHSNTALISDASFVKPTVEGRYFHPVSRRIVLATRLRLGGIEPYGGTTVIPSNVRYFAGGPGSVRGYALNRLGPLDEDGSPLGGNSLLEGSLELRFPIFGPVGGTVFVDYGNVFSPSFHYPLDQLKFSVGGGLSYRTPIGPLRFELAYAIDPASDDLRSPFLFSIGQSF
ncbi:MAG: outer membrane protein assembly factor BamA, partial [Gammaproteobacteria bacterium]|nr:outer membrane protein assembly factor BamA [Gammaproteobacteria bacterium]